MVKKNIVMEKGTRVRPIVPIKRPGYKPSVRSGIIKEITATEAVIEFEIPNFPKECSSCGSFMDLSVNGGTGEVICMRSGCGHEHGFYKEIRTIELLGLIDVDEEKKLEEKKEYQSKLNELLNTGIEKGIIDPQIKTAIEELI